jgi:hypothetical protein
LERLDIVELRLAHLRATTATSHGRPHVAVQNYLYCLETVLDSGDARAASFFAAQLARCYREMGLVEKACHYERLGAT